MHLSKAAPAEDDKLSKCLRDANHNRIIGGKKYRIGIFPKGLDAPAKKAYQIINENQMQRNFTLLSSFPCPYLLRVNFVPSLARTQYLKVFGF
jgi:hypothetical protein